MAPPEEADSGMESQGGSAHDMSPERSKGNLELTENENCDDEPEETLSERLWGLTEMFPDSVRNTTEKVLTKTSSGVKAAYSLSRSVFWVFFSSSVILFAPLIFEVERAQMEEMQRTQQKQMLLGPNAATTGGQHPVPLLPPIHR